MIGALQRPQFSGSLNASAIRPLCRSLLTAARFASMIMGGAFPGIDPKYAGIMRWIKIDKYQKVPYE
jgi:hypothetical protein